MGISCSSWKKKTEKSSVQAGLRTTKMKADKTLRRKAEEFKNVFNTTGTLKPVKVYLLGHVGCDEGSQRHQGEGQNEAQGKINEGSATQEYCQVEYRHKLQHSPALLRPFT